MEELILKTAKDVFSIPSVKPWQHLVIQKIMEHEMGKVRLEMLVMLPTGGGKSLCFMLPAYLLKGITIIVYPLLALMNDQAKRFESLGISSVTLRGGLSSIEKAKIFSDLESGREKIVITNIEMLSSPSVLERLEHLKIELLVFDEAHTIVTWGECFRPSYQKTKEVIDLLKPEIVSAFTATADLECVNKLGKLIFERDPYIIYGGLNRENIYYHAVMSLFPLEDIKNIIKAPTMRPALIFTRSRYSTQFIARELKDFFNIRYYHAGLSKEERIKIENWFYQSDDGALVSTCAYGMGVDKKNIRCVIHYDMPENASDYLQESGRGGRDGLDTHAYALLRAKDNSPLKEIFTSPLCFRKSLVEAMGRRLDGICSGCDSCDHITQVPFGEDIILKQVKRHPLLYKKHTLTRRLSHDKRFASVKDYEIERALSDLIKRKKLKLIAERLIYH